MKNATSQIFLNNQTITPEAIAEQLNNPGLPDWEKELYLFLNEWFSNSDFVVAQTSGSTGNPKPIKLSKSLMVKSAERTIDYFGLKKGDRLLLSLSCRYVAGKMMVVRAIVGQMNLITTDPSNDFDFLIEEKFDLGAMVPNQIFKILEQSSGTVELQNIRNLLIGGSGISVNLETQLCGFSNRIVLTYGMTETASHIAIRELSGYRQSDFYHCLPGISVSEGPNKCLQIHLPEWTEPIITNDLAELQSETVFKILGRADSIIISGGIKYSPETIEKKLENLILQRFIISSVPDDKLGERLVLVIEGKPYSTRSLREKIKEILPPFERPKSIFFLGSFPETTSGKVKREEVKSVLL